MNSIITITNLSRIYHQPGKTTPSQALDTISFSLATPGIYGVLGYNGAGKTTLLKILMGLMTLVLFVLHFTYMSIISDWNAFYTPSTESVKNIPEEFEYCHKSAQVIGNFPIRDIDTNEIIYNNRGLFNLLPVTHMMYIEGLVKRKSITYRKWSYFIPLGTLEFPCGQLGWP